MLSDRIVTALTKLLVVCLLGVMIVASYFLFTEEGLSGLLPSVLGLYLGVILVVGVFFERLFDTRVQLAFAVGLIWWGFYVYGDQSAVLGGVLVLTGVFHLTGQLHTLVTE